MPYLGAVSEWSSSGLRAHLRVDLATAYLSSGWPYGLSGDRPRAAQPSVREPYLSVAVQPKYLARWRRPFIFSDFRTSAPIQLAVYGCPSGRIVAG